MINEEALADQGKPLQEMLDQLARCDREGLVRLRDLQSFSRLLLQKEVRRLQRKLGPGHPRVKAMRANLVTGQVVHQHLKAKLQGSEIEITEVSGDDILFHGRVYDESGQGVIGSTIQILDERGEKLPVKDVDTDRNGYFEVLLKPELIAKLEGRPVSFRVINPEGKLLFEHSEPITLEAKKHRLVNVVVERVKAYPFSLKGVVRKRKATGSVELATAPRKAPTPKAVSRQKQARYLGNRHTMELHDLNCLKKQCQIDEIKEDHQVSFRTRKEATEAGYDFCAYCFGKDKSKR